MNARNRTTPLEIALLKKLDRLPVKPGKSIHIRQFDFSRYPVLCWYHGMHRKGRRYTMQCDVCEDGSLEVAIRPALNSGKALRMPKAKHFPGQIGG